MPSRAGWKVGLLLIVPALLIACSADAGGRSTTEPNVPDVGAVTPSPTPVRTPEWVPPPGATPRAFTDGAGDEQVTGIITNAVLATDYTRTPVDRGDGVTEELRGGVVAFTFDMNDPRATGVGTFDFDVDVYTQIAREWATFRLATGQGAWEGPCGGGSWQEGSGLLMSCWLTGSGAYDGYTYFMTFTGPANGDENGNGVVEGIIYPGEPPEV